METSLDVEELNSPDNKEFVTYLGREIDDFLKSNGNSNSIMLFPPFNSYKRLLTHHLVEFSYSNCGLSTFSIGEEPRRRTVVCLGSLRKGVLDDDANESRVQKSRPRSKPSLGDDICTPPARKLQADGNGNSNTPKVAERQRKVRKTISYYVPPHLRKSSESEPASKREKKDSGMEVVDSAEDFITPSSDEVVKVDSSLVSKSHERLECQNNESIGNEPKEFSKPISDIKGKNDQEPEVKSPSEMVSIDGLWDPLFCGKGTCSFPNVVIPILDDNEVSDITKEVGRVRVVEVKGPVLEQSSEGNDYVNSSMVEIYDLPEDMKTDDLAKIFEEYVNRGFRLRWVDESHALGIFSSSKTAEEALASEFARVKIRPIAEGTLLSREIARNVVLPSSFRPKTCSSIAKRLLSGALGLKVTPLSPEEKAAHRERLKECRDQRKKAPA
uniref:Growth inhibition and differentiation-related protein 88 n=1 Tax=Lygus hesperus TaxID=30085 RepID=A0A0A9WQW9_LYGHE